MATWMLLPGNFTLVTSPIVLRGLPGIIKQLFGIIQMYIFRTFHNRLWVYINTFKETMTAPASDWLRHFGLLLLNAEQIQWNLSGSKMSTTSTEFVFFMPMSILKWSSCPIYLKGGTQVHDMWCTICVPLGLLFSYSSFRISFVEEEHFYLNVTSMPYR